MRSRSNADLAVLWQQNKGREKFAKWDERSVVPPAWVEEAPGVARWSSLSSKRFFEWAAEDGLPVTWEKVGAVGLGDLLTPLGTAAGCKTQHQVGGAGQNGKKAPRKDILTATKDVAEGSAPSSVSAQAKLGMCLAAWQAGYCEFQPESLGIQAVLLGGKCCLCCWQAAGAPFAKL